jgi:hypothetical protein
VCVINSGFDLPSLLIYNTLKQEHILWTCYTVCCTLIWWAANIPTYQIVPVGTDEIQANKVCKIWGSHSNDYEDYCHLTCDAV